MNGWAELGLAMKDADALSIVKVVGQDWDPVPTPDSTDEEKEGYAERVGNRLIELAQQAKTLSDSAQDVVREQGYVLGLAVHKAYGMYADGLRAIKKSVSGGVKHAIEEMDRSLGIAEVTILVIVALVAIWFFHNKK